MSGVQASSPNSKIRLMMLLIAVQAGGIILGFGLWLVFTA